MDEAFIVTKNQIVENKLETNFLFPYAYQGSEVEKYLQSEPSEMIIYPYESDNEGNAILVSEYKLEQKAPNILTYLKQYKNKLENRMDSRKFYAKGDNWFRLVRQGKFSHISPKKIIVKGIGKTVSAGFLA